MNRTVTVERKTRETDISVTLVIDGTGIAKIETPVGFLNHLLESFARHGSVDLAIQAEGDLHVDQHHLIEDVGIVLGQAVDRALGERLGLMRAGYFIYPMDEALCLAAVDLGGRPFLQYDMPFTHQHCGQMEVGLLEDFLSAFSVHARANVVMRKMVGKSDHHIAEAGFKALGRAMRSACRIDEGNAGTVPSTKGVI